METGNTRTLRELGLRAFVKEFVQGYRLLRHIDPTIVMVIHTWIIAPFVIFAYKGASAFGRTARHPRRITRFVLNMDSDGQIFISGRMRIFWRSVLLLNAMCFDRLVIASTCGAQRIRALLPDKRKLVVMPSGYSSLTYSKVGYRDTARYPVILVVARVVRAKGHDILLRAFDRISGSLPQWSVHVVGPIQDRAYYSELVRLASGNGASRRVLFLGELDEDSLLLEYLHASVFCLPSLTEGFPAARLEAAALGLPVVTSEAGCGEDLGKYGAYVGPIGDVNWLASTLDNLLRDDQARYVSASRLQGHIISWQDFAERLIE